MSAETRPEAFTIWRCPECGFRPQDWSCAVCAATMESVEVVLRNEVDEAQLERRLALKAELEAARAELRQAYQAALLVEGAYRELKAAMEEAWPYLEHAHAPPVTKARVAVALEDSP